ncbi:Hemicentin-1 [Exaiptasia diaphana]|nr:Hemicentin-1 [Exaiptasia diaphana]
MVASVIGLIGPSVLLFAMAGNTLDIDSVTTRSQCMVGKTAKENCMKNGIVTQKLVQLISTSNNQIFHDGVYDIYPRGPSNPPIKTYCDMSRDGGGWTLLVSSATNTWTADDVMSRNAGKPSLTDDYSILKYADVIKDNQKVQGSTFEYRLEADRPVSFTVTCAILKAFAPQNGGFSSWSDWSKCTGVCNGGKQTRHRFCNNPFPMYGGKDCQGKLHEERDCNTKACPKANSCRHLQFISTSNNQIFHDGVYDIYPRGPSNSPIKTYCDMSRDGGGWTLLVSSATNTWTADDVMSRNAGKPSLTDDYSILKYADVIKDNQKVQGSTFEYRLEADRPG